MEQFLEMMKFIRRLRDVEPLKSIIVDEVTPSANCTSDEDSKNFIKDWLFTTFRSSPLLQGWQRKCLRGTLQIPLVLRACFREI